MFLHILHGPGAPRRNAITHRPPSCQWRIWEDFEVRFTRKKHFPVRLCDIGHPPSEVERGAWRQTNFGFQVKVNPLHIWNIESSEAAIVWLCKWIAGIAQAKFPWIEAIVRNETLPSDRAVSHIFLTAAALANGREKDWSFESTIKPKYCYFLSQALCV